MSSFSSLCSAIAARAVPSSIGDLRFRDQASALAN